jgi:acyl phosphate:glycerol-3-phosphate acyltransferase
MIANVAAIVIAYLLGSIPFAYIIPRLTAGVDIRNLGLGNAGAANVFREVSRWKGVLVWAADVIKGASAVLIAIALGVSQPWVLGAGFAALVGHCFPVYIGFRGGIGAATFMGIFLVNTPEAMAITFVLMSIPFLIAHRVIVAIMAVAPILLVLIWVFEHSWLLVAYAAALLLFMAIKSIPGALKKPTTGNGVNDKAEKVSQSD